MILSYVSRIFLLIHCFSFLLSICTFKPIRKGWQSGREHDVHCQPLIYRFESYSLRCFFFFGFRLCPDFFTLSRSMFFRAIKAVISKQPEALNLSDFFILRFITSVLIFVVMIRRINRDFALKSLHIWFLAQNQPKSAFPWYSRMTVLSCQRSYTSKVLSPYCLRRLHFIEMRRSSCSWWGVSAL